MDEKCAHERSRHFTAVAFSETMRINVQGTVQVSLFFEDPQRRLPCPAKPSQAVLCPVSVETRQKPLPSLPAAPRSPSPLPTTNTFPKRENQRQINTDPAALRQTSRARRGEVLQQAAPPPQMWRMAAADLYFVQIIREMRGEGVWEVLFSPLTGVKPPGFEKENDEEKVPVMARPTCMMILPVLPH
ncbi:unnamed protein product [Gadus morhua 'NCC']